VLIPGGEVMLFFKVGLQSCKGYQRSSVPRRELIIKPFLSRENVTLLVKQELLPLYLVPKISGRWLSSDLTYSVTISVPVKIIEK